MGFIWERVIAAGSTCETCTSQGWAAFKSSFTVGTELLKLSWIQYIIWSISIDGSNWRLPLLLVLEGSQSRNRVWLSIWRRVYLLVTFAQGVGPGSFAKRGTRCHVMSQDIKLQFRSQWNVEAKKILPEPRSKAPFQCTQSAVACHALSIEVGMFFKLKSGRGVRR